jgi:hypothetical protein
MSGSNSLAPGAHDAAPPAAEPTAEPVSFAVHSLPVPGLAPPVRNGRLKMLLVLLVCAAPVIASYFTYYVIRPQARTNHGELIDPQRPMPPAAALPLTDLQGQPVDPKSLAGQWLFIAVAGGACDSACERQLYLQRQLREGIGKDKARLDRVWLIDDAQAPRPELAAALQGATVLRVPSAALRAWLAPAPGQPLSAHFYLVDPLGNWMMRTSAPSDPARIKRDLERLMRGSASWDLPGR